MADKTIQGKSSATKSSPRITETDRQKVLVADDNREILQVVRLLLEPKGYEVVTTQKDILSTVKNLHPSLLLLDVLMSGEDGRVITQSIKSSKSLRDIPVVLFSAKNDLAKIAHEAGADGYLEKPFESRNLFRIIERHARRVDYK